MDDPEQLAHPAGAPAAPTATVLVTVLVGVTAVVKEAATITIGIYPFAQVKEVRAYELVDVAAQAVANEAPKVN